MEPLQIIGIVLMAVGITLIVSGVLLKIYLRNYKKRNRK